MWSISTAHYDNIIIMVDHWYVLVSWLNEHYDTDTKKENPYHHSAGADRMDMVSFTRRLMD